MRTYNTSENSILLKTLGEMKDVFTSNEFNKKAIKNGFNPAIIKRKGLSNFLHKHATNEYFGSKTWTKKTKSVKRVEFNITEEEAIAFLKSKGYKILKPITDFLEI